MGSYLMHSTQLQDSITLLEGLLKGCYYVQMKHRYEKHGQSELAWYVDEDNSALEYNLILFVTPMKIYINIHSIHISKHTSEQF